MCAGPVSAHGLGGLGAVQAIYMIAFAIIALGAFVLTLNLAQINRSETDKHGKSDRFTLIASITYLLVASPVFIWLSVYPRLDFLVYLIVFVYLAALTTALHKVFTNKRHMIAFFGAAFLYILLRTPEIISYTEYHLIDNVPLLKTVELTEQKDNQYIHLRDGRIFRFTERYNSSGQEQKFDADAKLMIEGPLKSKERGVYTLHGSRISQEYHNLRNTHGNPFITIPINIVTLNKNEAYHVGLIELLDANWKADNRTLTRAIVRYCCDSAWVEELIRRGADPNEVGYKNSSLLHLISGEAPYGEEIERAADILIKSGANINATNDQGKTPLYVAIESIQRHSFRQSRLSGSEKSYVKLLLEIGANPNISDNKGNTPLHATIPVRFYELSRLLLEHGANSELPDSKGESAYELAQYYFIHQKAALSDEEESELENLIHEMKQLTQPYKAVKNHSMVH